MYSYSPWGYCRGLATAAFCIMGPNYYSVMTLKSEHIHWKVCEDLHQIHLESWRKVNPRGKDKSNVSVVIVVFSYLASLVVEPNKGMIPGQDLAVEGGIVLGWATPSHRPADLDWLIQVYMPLLEWMRVGSAGEHGQR